MPSDSAIMASGFFGTMIMCFTMVCAIVLLGINVTAAGYLTAEQSWFGDPISTWLSVNTYFTFGTMGVYIFAIICSCLCSEGAFMCHNLGGSVALVMFAFFFSKIVFAMSGAIVFSLYFTEWTKITQVTACIVALQLIVTVPVVIRLVMIGIKYKNQLKDNQKNDEKNDEKID